MAQGSGMFLEASVDRLDALRQGRRSDCLGEETVRAAALYLPRLLPGKSISCTRPESRRGRKLGPLGPGMEPVPNP
jgi:hypothetical protein